MIGIIGLNGRFIPVALMYMNKMISLMSDEGMGEIIYVGF